MSATHTGADPSTLDGVLERSPERRLPLCVDLDGTLIKSDVLLESILILLKKRPWAAVLIFWWALRGRSVLKSKLADAVALTVEMLPYCEQVVQFLKEQRASGRQLILVTAAHQSVAEKVANHLGGFTAVYGSSGSTNLKAEKKADFLVARLGKGKFDYIGDARADLPVWRAAGAAYVVGSRGFAQRVARDARVVQVFPVERPSLVEWLRSIRLLHWSKNLLVLLPVLLAHKLHWHGLRETFMGVLLFGSCASGLYILNDLLDLHSDRLHPSKSNRPFAAGRFSLRIGLVQAMTLTGLSIAAAIYINPRFAAVLLGYAVLTIAYSWKLKQIAVLDVFVLSSFYTIRIWAGGIISSTPVSDWLTAFSLFFFLSLAMAKRHSELQTAGEFVERGSTGRGYLLQDRELLAMFGVASSFAAVVILCLYVRSPELSSLYRNPAQLLWLCPVVLYWLTRVWLLAGRGRLDHDPVLFAFRDRASWMLGAAVLLILAMAGIQPR
jgi:4-hydroxybenzoate polyprenyltransferase/phosphoserine phosphatase